MEEREKIVVGWERWLKIELIGGLQSENVGNGAGRDLRGCRRVRIEGQGAHQGGRGPLLEGDGNQCDAKL